MHGRQPRHRVQDAIHHTAAPFAAGMVHAGCKPAVRGRPRAGGDIVQGTRAPVTAAIGDTGWGGGRRFRVSVLTQESWPGRRRFGRALVIAVPEDWSGAATADHTY